MAEELDALEEYVSGMMSRMEEGERRGMARRIGQALRRSQTAQIAGQKNPDGSSFEPRKRARRGSLRRGAGGQMFRKLRSPRFLRLESGADEVRLSFAGAAARIAEVHHFALRDKVSRQPGAPEVQYTSRRLLGLKDSDRELIMDVAIEQARGG